MESRSENFPSKKNIKAEGLDLDYIEHFLTKKEADELFDWMELEVKYFSGDLTKVRIFGKWHNIPRKQVAFGDPGLVYKYSGTSVPALPWPEPIMKLREDIYRKIGYDYNFVLVNRYQDGRDHMGEHKDDEAELDQSAGIASVSLGQVRDFVFKHGEARGKHGARKDIPPVKLALGHGSLLLMKHPTNSHWYHSLPPRKSALGTRINLTFRRVDRSLMSKAAVE